MSKQAAIISFSSLANQTSFVNGVNSNIAALNAAFLNTLSLDGSTPNSMLANLDMNSNRILNLPIPQFPNDPLRLQDIGSTATMTLIANSIAVSSFFNPILQMTTSLAVRSAFGVSSYISDIGAQAGSQFYPLTSNVNTSLVRSANTSQIQAAIDYAYNNGQQTITLSAGTFWCANGIYLDAPGNLRAAGQVQFTSNPANNTTVTILNTTITFVNSGAAGLQVNIGASLSITLASLLSLLNGSADINLTKFTYGVAGNNLNVTAVSLTPTVISTTVSGTTVLGASSPTIFSFSLHLKGAGGLSNHNTSGTLLYFQDNSQPGLILGPGQGMMVSYLSVISSIAQTSNAALPISGAGIAYGGHWRCFIEGVGVENWRKGYSLGFNGYNTLGDSNTMLKCTAIGNYVGHHIQQNQNYINSLINCDFGGNTTSVLSDVAKEVNIIGGNHSYASAKHNAFTISAVSSLTYLIDSSQTGYFVTDNASFTCTISSPDQPMKDGAYDAFVINTVAFGPIPLLLTNFNVGTNVATFKFYQGWLLGSGMQTNLLNGGALATTFNTALSGATTLYACETVTPFDGLCFTVDGTHIENPDSYTRFFHHHSGFGGCYASKFNMITFNWTINGVNDHGGSAAFEAIFQCQQSFPFIQMLENSAGTIELSNISNVSGGSSFVDRIIFDMFQASNSLTKRIKTSNCDLRPNLRSPGPTIDTGVLGTATGFGEWDTSPFMAGTDVYYTQVNQPGAVPYYGYFPAPWATPSLDGVTLTTLQGSLPGLGNYPALMGRTPYRVYYPYVGNAGAVSPTASRFIESNHTLWSYGQNLTVNWSYVAGSHVVTLNDFRYVFAGLRLLINNGGGNESYVCTGVYPSLGFITVIRWRPGTSIHDTAGTAGTTYNGASISQEPFSFSYMGNLPATSIPTNSNAGAQTAAVGDLTGAGFITLTLSAIGANAYTTRTATQMFGDVNGAYTNLSWLVTIRNTSSGATTFTAGTGVTITGNAIIPPNMACTYEATFTSPTACTYTFENIASALPVPVAALPNIQTGASYTVGPTDYLIIANVAGTQTETLPTPASNAGRLLKVKTITNQTVVSASANVIPLAGGAAGTAILAATAGKWAELQCDGTNWNIIASN